MNHKQIPISEEKYSVIYALFSKDLVVATSYSAPDGSDLHPNKGEMMTEWALDGEHYPLIGNRRTWTISQSNNEQLNPEQSYWLCSPQH